MAELITPAQLQQSRDQFLRGGPDGVREPMTISVFAHGTSELGEPVYSFDRLLVFQVTHMDAEHTVFVQASNRTVKLYSFERAVMTLAVQALVADGQAKDNDEARGVSQQAYQQLLWLYENELKISIATLKQRTIVLRMHGMRYYGYVTAMTDGWAADADWIVPVSLEFVVLRAEMIKLPDPSRVRNVPVPVTGSAGLTRREGLAIRGAAASAFLQLDRTVAT